MSDFDLDEDSSLPVEHRPNPIKDTSNPRSIVNIVPASVSKAISFIPESIFEMTTKELKENAKITEVEERLRIAFWREYDSAQCAMRRINLSNVYGGVCSQPHFLKTIITNPFKLAYILTVPLDYEVQMREMLNFGFDQLRDILAQPHVNEDGTPNPKMADVKQKIVESLHLRVHGAVPWRMETKNLNVNVDKTTQPKRTSVDDLKNMKDIDERLRQLEIEAFGGEVIDVEPKEDSSSEG